MSTAELSRLEANPEKVRITYWACGCPCSGGHDSLERRVCIECGDVAETHYLMIPVTDAGRLIWYHARRGYDEEATT